VRDYDDWVEQLPDTARSKVEMMNERISRLVDQLAAERAARQAAEAANRQSAMASMKTLRQLSELREFIDMHEANDRKVVQQLAAALALVAERDATIRGLRDGIEELRVLALLAEGMGSVQRMAIEFGFIQSRARALLAPPAADPKGRHE
jgi:vacuolar-type H+-ATPase subunit I/STV1